MLLLALFNRISATERQGQNFDAAMVDGCSFIDWHYSDLHLRESTPLREQNKDYSSNQRLSIVNIELQPKLNSGGYKTKLVVPR